MCVCNLLGTLPGVYSRVYVQVCIIALIYILAPVAYHVIHQRATVYKYNHTLIGRCMITRGYAKQKHVFKKASVGISFACAHVFYNDMCMELYGHTMQHLLADTTRNRRLAYRLRAETLSKAFRMLRGALNNENKALGYILLNKELACLCLYVSMCVCVTGAYKSVALMINDIPYNPCSLNFSPDIIMT